MERYWYHAMFSLRKRFAREKDTTSTAWAGVEDMAWPLDDETRCWCRSPAEHRLTWHRVRRKEEGWWRRLVERMNEQRRRSRGWYVHFASCFYIDIYCITGCYYTSYYNTYAFSLLFYKVYEEGECRQLEFWTGKGANVGNLFCTTPKVLRLHKTTFGN